MIKNTGEDERQRNHGNPHQSKEHIGLDREGHRDTVLSPWNTGLKGFRAT